MECHKGLGHCSSEVDKMGHGSPGSRVASAHCGDFIPRSECIERDGPGLKRLMEFERSVFGSNFCKPIRHSVLLYYD